MVDRYRNDPVVLSCRMVHTSCISLVFFAEKAFWITALFLSSLALLCSLVFSAEHIATMICGTVWLLAMLLRRLLRFKYVEYVYLFIRFARD